MTLQRVFRPPLLAALLLLLWNMSGNAQNYRARIQGVITDPSQATIANAAVSLLNVATGVTVVRQSSETGLYVFDFVDAGTYTLTVEVEPVSISSFRRTSPFRCAATSLSTPPSRPGTVQESITVTESPVQPCSSTRATRILRSIPSWRRKFPASTVTRSN